MYSICSHYSRDPNMEQRRCYVCVNRIKNNFDTYTPFAVAMFMMILAKHRAEAIK